jgi:exosome complex RNA-binding protein Csl4
MIDATDPTDAAVRALPIRMLDDEPEASARLADPDPGVVVLTCANCGAAMDERKCKLICRCGYFLSCSDYY